MERINRLIGRLDRWTMKHRWTRVVRSSIEGFLEHEGLQYAGSMSYFAVLSLFQLIVLAVVVLSFFLGEGPAREMVIGIVDEGTPLDAATVGQIIDGAIAARGTMTLISFAFLVWAALGIFSALSNGIGRAFAQAPVRGFVHQQVLGLTLMALTGVLVLASFGIGILTGILQRMAERAPLDLPIGELGIQLIGLVVPVVLIFATLWTIYRIVPNRPVAWRVVLPGAIVGTILWTILRFGFTWYATAIARYDSFYGPLSAGISLLVFLYFASCVVLIGAEVARANALSGESPIRAAEDRRAAADPATRPQRPPSGGIPKSAWLAFGGLVGVLIGRFTKRDEY